MVYPSQTTQSNSVAFSDDADDFEDEVEPEPEPEHSSLVNMLYNNDGDGDDYFGYDEDAY